MELQPVSDEPLLQGSDAENSTPLGPPQAQDPNSLRRPREPPPPEAFNDLPDDLVFAERKKRKTAEELRKEREEAEERARLEALARMPPPEPPPEPEEFGKRAYASSRRAAAGRRFGPPPPQLPPPKPAKIIDSIVPRGVMQIRLDRCVGVGPGFGGQNDSRPGTQAASRPVSRLSFGSRPSTRQAGSTITTASVYLKWELVIGGGQPMDVEEGSTASGKVTKVVRFGARSPVYKDVTMADWSTPEVPEDDNAYDPHSIVFKCTDGCPTVPAPESLSDKERAKLPPMLFYSLWRESKFMGSEKLVAEGVIPASSFFVLNPDKWVDVCLPLYPPGEAAPELAVSGIDAPAYMTAYVHFAPSQAGILGLTLHDGRDLPNMEKYGGGKMDVFVRVQVGDHWHGKKPPPGIPEPLTTATIVEGGCNPSLGDQEVLVWVDHAVYASGLPLQLSVWDENQLSSNTQLGSARLNIQDWTKDTGQHSDLVVLHGAKNKEAGAVSLTRTWYPAGSLSVRVVKARNLTTGDAFWGNDAFAKILLDGRVKSHVDQTGVAEQAGEDPVFQEQFVFDLVDHAEMRVQVWDKDKFTRNDLIGEVIVDLPQVFRVGVKDGWVPLKKKGDWGGFEDSGEIRLEVDFMGPPGVAYPQLRPDVVAYDDKERRARLGLSAQAQLAADAAEKSKQDEIERERQAALRELQGDDFKEEDVEKAFKQADLDGNLVLNAGELRHLLVCMGELITDGEVDTMVGMVDADGDGTVAFYEFYQIARTSADVLNKKDWRPAKEDKFRDAVNGPAVKPPPIIIYGPNGEPLQVIDAGADAESRKKAMMRAQDLAKKGEKKKLCEAVAAAHQLRLPELQRIFRRWTGLPSFAEGHVTYPELLSLFDVEGDPADPVVASILEKWRELFVVFQRPGTGKLNVRELLLALNNFSGTTRNQRVNFAFFLFDADESGELNFEELVEILRANHLVADADTVRKKAETIMAAADRDTSGFISLEEFVVIASRFPNVLFPNFAVASDEALSAVAGGPGEGSAAADSGRASDEMSNVYIKSKGKGK